MLTDTPTYATSQYTYDNAGDAYTSASNTSADFDVGNLIAVTDPNGNRTEYVYEDTNKIFVKETRLPKYFAPSANLDFVTKSNWHYGCGLATREVDLNERITTRIYDPLCRITSENRWGTSGGTAGDQPGPDETTTSYVGFTGLAPTAQYIQTSRTAPAGSGTVWSRSYLDGFGREWLTLREGPGTDTIRTTRNFDKRGHISAQSRPYYTGAVAQFEEYAYDQLDRLVKQTHADGTDIDLTHGLSTAAGEINTIVQADETGRQTRFHFDGFGKLVARVAIGGPERITLYDRDLFGRIISITDPGESTWAYTYDRGGRRTQVVDPDLGQWTYSYDAGGRLTSQRDAKWQLTTLAYDRLDRVTTKATQTRPATSTRDTPVAPTFTELTTNTYDETTASGSNLGRLTQTRKDTYRHQRYGHARHH